MKLTFCLTAVAPLLASWVLTLVRAQLDTNEFHGHTEAEDGTVLWFDGEEPDNLTSWVWETHGASGRTWHWAGDNGTTWTTWLWSSKGPEDNHGGGFLLSSPLSPLRDSRASTRKSEAQKDGSNNCNPCCGAAWALNGPTLTWTTPPESNSAFNFNNWMMQQGGHCWGFNSKPDGWGFVFENVTIGGDKSGPGEGACAFPSVTLSHPSVPVHTHGLRPSLGPVGVGKLGFAGVPTIPGGFGGFGLGLGLGPWVGGPALMPGFGFGLGGLGTCPHAGFLWRRRRDTETFDEATEVADGDTGKKPTWLRRWLTRARDFLISIAQASQDDEGKGGWTIPLGNGFIQVGPNLLRKVTGWIGGAVLTVLGGNPVDPETQVAIETILLDPYVIEAVRNATEQGAFSDDAS